MPRALADRTQRSAGVDKQQEPNHKMSIKGVLVQEASTWGWLLKEIKWSYCSIESAKLNLTIIPKTTPNTLEG